MKVLDSASIKHKTRDVSGLIPLKMNDAVYPLEVIFHNRPQLLRFHFQSPLGQGAVLHHDPIDRVDLFADIRSRVCGQLVRCRLELGDAIEHLRLLRARRLNAQPFRRSSRFRKSEKHRGNDELKSIFRHGRPFLVIHKELAVAGLNTEDQLILLCQYTPAYCVSLSGDPVKVFTVGTARAGSLNSSAK